MAILKEAAFMKPPFTVKTEVHGVKGVWVVQLLAEACTGINNDGLKHNVRDRVETERYIVTNTGVTPSCKSNLQRV
jgi:triphosphoribosyl-dephospho-CoA synthetase